MSPTPVSNDPGDDGDQGEVRAGDVPAAVLMAAAAESSSDEDDEEDLNENVGHEIGYQLLTPGMLLQAPAGPDDSDDDDDDYGSACGACSGGDDDDDGKDAHENLEVENAAGVELSNEATDSQSHQKHLQLPPLPPNQELRELWKTSRVDPPVVAMPQDQIDAVKSAMAGFHLPASCLPHWASIIPETEWKTQLLLQLELGKVTSDVNESKVEHSVADEGSLEGDASKADKLETSETSSGKVCT